MLQVFLIVVGGSVAFFLLMWTVVYAIQLIRPDGPKPLHKDKDLVRRIQLKAGLRTQVWFADIRNIEKTRVLVGPGEEEYVYSEGMSSGWPDVWDEDVYRRRN